MDEFGRIDHSKKQRAVDLMFRALRATGVLLRESGLRGGEVIAFRAVQATSGNPDTKQRKDAERKCLEDLMKSRLYVEIQSKAQDRSSNAKRSMRILQELSGNCSVDDKTKLDKVAELGDKVAELDDAADADHEKARNNADSSISVVVDNPLLKLVADDSDPDDDVVLRKKEVIPKPPRLLSLFNL